MGARTPSVTPAENQFSLTVYNADGAVSDAVLSIPGRAINAGLWLAPRPLLWTAADAGQASSVTIGFSVKEALTRGTLGSVLVKYPEGFFHTMGSSSQVKISSALLPVLRDSSRGGRGGWVDISLADRWVIQLDPDSAVPAGVYDFQFPVTVPEQMPAFNFWQLTVCRPSTGAQCLQPDSPQSLATFPHVGFRLNAAPVGIAISDRSDASRAFLFFGKLIRFLLAMSLCFP
ncbi:unnamed protein product [Polarella glacialis]|uniref:Uncharacterized protein n=1 Tax=Polarella glacialis TaxID=89957 RepID=A0A813H8X7_POLGL|nr:unnamed protein product [Polarella glacialis]